MEGALGRAYRPALEASRRGRKEGNSGVLKQGVLLEPCRLPLAGGFFKTSKEGREGDTS